MPYQLNEKLRGLTPYDPIEGEYRIRLDANESFLPLPPNVRAQLQERIACLPFERYPDPLCGELCRAFAGYYDIDPAYVTAGNGSDELISILTGSFLMKGQTVATLEPDFSMYRFYASAAEMKTVSIPKEENLQISVDKVIDACRAQRPDMLIFSNPCNPTGQGLAKEEVRRLITALEDVLVVVDEAYMDFWDQSLISEVIRYDNAVLLRTCSKAVGGAGMRLGFAVANQQITNALRAIKSPYNVNSMSQAAGACLLSHKQELQQAKETLIAARQELQAGLERLAGAYSQLCVYPSCTNFVLVALPHTKELFDYLKSNGIVVRYMGRYLRITAGNPEENSTLLQQIENFLAHDATV